MKLDKMINIFVQFLFLRELIVLELSLGLIKIIP